MKREGNNPKRRFISIDEAARSNVAALASKMEYVGSGHHKRYPADYGFERVSPRPTKSLCDGIRIVPLNEAKRLFVKGISATMFSSTFEGKFPKYVWSMDSEGEVYEAKTDINSPGMYHGYRLEEDDNFRDFVRKVWDVRCPRTGK